MERRRDQVDPFNSRDVEQLLSRRAASPGVRPHLPVSLLIAGDDFLLECMLLIAEDESPVHDNVADG